MDLTHLPDKELLAKTTKDIRDEKEALIRVLWDIKEIERRRLFCDEKCSSLYQYLVKVHHYADHEAGTRVAAMRLLNELPQIEEKIKEPSKPQPNSYTQIKREIFKEANDKCENCAGNYALETEHHIPIAKGGSNTKENL